MVTQPKRLVKVLKKVHTNHFLTFLKNLYVFPKAVWLSELAKREGIQHIHAHWLTTPATIAMVASQLANIPWSCTAHRGDIVANNLLREKLSHASFVRFISNSGIDLAQKVSGIPISKGRLLHMGVDVPDEINEVKVTSDTKSFVVLCPANLVKIKGHEVLLKAWSMIESPHHKFQLLLAGDGELRNKLEQLAKSLCIKDTVKFLGHISHEQILEWYKNKYIDLVVLPSQDLGHGIHEGIPVSLMEAMAHAVPVISTKTGGIPELLQGGAGIMVQHSDAKKMAEQIERLVGDEVTREYIRKVGRERVMNDFNEEIIIKTLISWFHEALGTGDSELQKSS